MREQLFENVSRPTFWVGNKKTQRYVMASSFLFHFVVIVVLLVTAPAVTKNPPDNPKPVMMTFSAPSYFYNPEPPAPPPKQKSEEKKLPDKKLAEQKKEQVVAKDPEPVVTAPVEAPNEIKTESSSDKEKENSANSTEDSVSIGGGPGVKGGVRGGVPGGVVGSKSPSRGSPTSIDEPVRVGGSIAPPRKIKNSEPIYPPNALEVRLEGTVIIEAIIGKNGKIMSAKVIKSIPLLDSAALEAVEKWEYAPMIIGGKTVEVILTVTVTFKIT